MATRKTKAAPKPAGRAARRSAKPAVKPAKRAQAKRAAGKPRAEKVKPAKIAQLDLSVFPPESISVLETWICLACVADVFTRHLKLAPRSAHLAIKGYTPSIAELYAPVKSRPWFDNQPLQTHCPYCGAGSKWHTRIVVYRIESGRATDAPRRDLFKSLPQSGNPFAVFEEKATRQHAFYEWLEKISTVLNLDDPAWLLEVSRHYLGRKEPKTDWQSLFAGIQSIRRSRRLEEGWEAEDGRLFLSPGLFDELLLIQYLVSRSHKAGGTTFEGRYTLPELFVRLRNSGYLRAAGIQAQNPADALEELVAYLGGGEAAIKFYHLVDRRDFLQKVSNLKNLKPPRPKRPIG